MCIRYQQLAVLNDIVYYYDYIHREWYLCEAVSNLSSLIGYTIIVNKSISIAYYHVFSVVYHYVRKCMLSRLIIYSSYCITKNAIIYQ